MSYHELMLGLVRARYERGTGEAQRREILANGERNGLVDAEGVRTSKYFAMLNDEVADLAHELTGGRRFCACGCGRLAKLGQFALKACRFKARVLRKSRTEVLAL